MAGRRARASRRQGVRTRLARRRLRRAAVAAPRVPRPQRPQPPAAAVPPARPRRAWSRARRWLPLAVRRRRQAQDSTTVRPAHPRSSRRSAPARAATRRGDRLRVSADRAASAGAGPRPHSISSACQVSRGRRKTPSATTPSHTAATSAESAGVAALTVTGSGGIASRFGRERRRSLGVTRLDQPHRAQAVAGGVSTEPMSVLVDPGGDRDAVAGEGRCPTGMAALAAAPGVLAASPTTTTSRSAGGCRDSQPTARASPSSTGWATITSASKAPARSSAMAAEAAAVPTAPSTTIARTVRRAQAASRDRLTNSGPAEASTAATTVTSRAASSQGSRRRRRRRRRGVVRGDDAHARHDDAGHGGPREQMNGDRNRDQHEAAENRRREPLDAHDQPRLARAMRNRRSCGTSGASAAISRAAQPRPAQGDFERPVVPGGRLGIHSR